MTYEQGHKYEDIGYKIPPDLPLPRVCNMHMGNILTYGHG
jgi:hypothetical protein